MSKFRWLLLGLTYITVVSYETVQPFCSDVIVQNVNDISSPACKVVCFKKTSLRFTYQVIYVRNIPIHNWIHLFCLTTCFFGFIRFRCNILLKKIFTDLLLLALILALSVNKFPNLSCAITWTVDWCQIYIFITQKSGNFKYTLHCVRACVIMITLNRF